MLRRAQIGDAQVGRVKRLRSEAVSPDGYITFSLARCLASVCLPQSFQLSWQQNGGEHEAWK